MDFCLWYKNTNRSFCSECEYFLSEMSSQVGIYLLYYIVIISPLCYRVLILPVMNKTLFLS